MEVLAGEDTVGVVYELNNLNLIRSGIAPCFITFQAEAGHAYVANGESSADGTTWRCWIEDTRTGQRAEGVFCRNGADRIDLPPARKQNAPPK